MTGKKLVMMMMRMVHSEEENVKTIKTRISFKHAQNFIEELSTCTQVKVKGKHRTFYSAAYWTGVVTCYTK